MSGIVIGMRHIVPGIASICLLLVLAMAVPVWPALAAGLAGTSLVVFGMTGVLLLVLGMRSAGRTRLLVVAVAALNVAAAVLPQLAFYTLSSRMDVTLTFDPVSYLTFSGDADIPPTQTIDYKRVGTDPLRAALYRPRETGPVPAVVLLHGGGWRYGNHLETGQWPRLLTDAGFAVVSIEYRLAGDDTHTWRDAPEDVADALNYVRANAERLQIDGDRLHLLGQSAGGHLALLEAYRNRSVRSVVSLYAPVDLRLDYETSRDKSAELDFVGGPPAQYGDRYDRLSPLRYVSPSSPPTLAVQGTYDDLVHPTQAQLLADRLGASGVRHETLLLPLTGHSFENQRGGFATQLTTQRVVQFLKS